MSPPSPRVPNPSERPIDDYRPIKAICIGAGMSGIAIGCLLPPNIPNFELTIYEKNTEVGGTWFENHYPGLRPDLSPHVYQYSFASNPNWSRYYPPGPEFEEYLKAVSKKFDIYKYIKFSHKFTTAQWLPDLGQWEVTVVRMEDGTVIKDYAEILIKSTGLINEWRWPSIPGREEFQGKMLHTANWDDDFDPAGKNVAVIGYGSTGVQVTPAIQPVVGHLDHYVRGRVWVPPGGGTGPQEMAKRGAAKNFDHPEEERRKFYENPKEYLKFRKEMEQYTNGVQAFFMKGSPALEMFTQMVDGNMKQTLKEHPDIYEKLKPDYPPGCRRLIMGQAWIECLTKNNADLIAKDLQRFTKKGIVDEDGVEREYDAIICATGFDTSLGSGNMEFIGENGTKLAEVWDPDPVAYFSINPPKMPNMFVMFGPNSAPASASIVHTFEGAAHYIIKCIRKIQGEYLKSMVCKPQALKSWLRHVDWQHSTTVLTANCRTWFKRNKNDGRVITSWPGSALASMKGWESPRWEDYEYQSWLPDDNNMSWLGNGFTVAEQNMDWGNTVDYMDWEDESTVMLIDNPVFTGPKLHEEVYRLAELNPGLVDLNVRHPGISGTKNAPLNGTESNADHVAESVPVKGLDPQGEEVTLAEKVDDKEPKLNGSVEVKLPGVSATLLAEEAKALNNNL